MEDQDAVYIRLCQDGQPEAYRHLVNRHGPGLVSYLRGRLGQDAAHEVAQEALVRGFMGIAKLRKPEAFFCWVVGIALRVVKEERRQGWQVPQTASAQEPAASDHEERDGEIREAVAGLPEKYRHLVLLRYYGGLTCAEIGRQLGVPLGTVTKRLSRAYGLLRAALDEEGRRERTEVRR